MICKYTIICLMALIVLFFIHLLIIKLNYASDPVSRDKKFLVENGQTKTGLYSSDDKVFQLTTFNFNENVYNSSSAWVVQFYNSWCGHCIKFSPIWKELATDIYSWRDVVVIAAIDCADDLNTQHCRDYEIMGYPTIRYFGPWTSNLTNGEEFPRTGTDEVSFLRHTVITKLEATEKKGIPPKWPDLLLVPDDDVAWKDRGKQLKLYWNDPVKQIVLLVIENENSFSGSELVLDLKDVTNVTVKRVLDSVYGSPQASPSSLSSSVQVFAFFRPKEGYSVPAEPASVPLVADSRQTIYASVRKYLLSLGVAVSDIFAERRASNGPKTYVQQQTVDQLALVHTVFLDDLNMALRYSLFHEIPLQSTITGDKLVALVKYVDVLNKFFPHDELSRSLLSTVSQELAGYKRLSGLEFKKMARQYGFQFEKTRRDWVACKGSDSTLRGYPCGLWTMFHTLTAREYATSLEPLGGAGAARAVGFYSTPTTLKRPPEVLDAMAAYIRHFFGCSDCADHFTEMSRTIAGNVTRAEDGVLWLWRAHNNVNARLAGDASEDPAFPKIQFPSSRVCLDCRDADGVWRLPKVLDFLVSMYGDLRRTGDGSNALAQHLRLNDGEELRSPESATEKGWSLSLTDMRTCIALYALCACLLTVYTLRFFVKRNPRNRSPKYDFTTKA